MSSNQVKDSISFRTVIETNNENILYLIPEYQREYVWEKEQVNALIEDFIDPLDPKRRIPHFIGTITRCPTGIRSKTGCIEMYLIDGQQRFTTLMLYFHALNTIFRRNHNSSEPKYAETDSLLDERLNCSVKGAKYARLVPNELNRSYYTDTISQYCSNNYEITKNKQKDTENECMEIAFYTIYTKLFEYYNSAVKKLEFII